MNKKGIYFSIEAFFATTLLLLGLVLITKFSFNEVRTEQINYLSKDLLSTLGELKINEVNNSWIQSQISDGNITEVNNSLLEQIGEFWALGQIDKARNLSTIIVDEFIPSIYGASILVDNDLIYLKNKTSSPINLVTSRKMVTGVKAGSPIEGSAGAASIKKIKSKKTSSFAYFGGFVGQGNITVLIDDFPIDISNATITEILLELDSASDFGFKINSQLCNSSLQIGIGNMTPDIFDMTDCKNLIQSGTNNFTIVFPDISNNSYIAGGYIKVSYRTNETQENNTLGIKRFYFPNIEGVINLYDSFYVPGTLNGINIKLHYFSNHTNNSNFSTYLSIGEIVVFNDTNSTTEQTIQLSNATLSSLLNYSFLSEKTIPTRLSSYEYTVQEIITGGNADVILITDYSGSMKKAVSDWSQGNAGGDCDTIYGDPDIRRTELAICLDIEFVDLVMNYSGNRIWPVFMHDDQSKFYTGDPTNKTAIKTYIDSFSFQGKGKTCVSCAVNNGYDILNNNSNSSRDKFIVVMTDGVPTHCPQGSCFSNSSVYGVQQCEGLCDTSGTCDAADIPIQCSECTINDGAINSTYYSVNRSRNDLNATIYSIGFGPVNDCSKANETLTKVAEIGNGTYQHSNNVSLLKLIYEEIAYDILDRTTQVSQTVVSQNVTSSILYGDSFIEINFTPNNPTLKPGEISVIFQTDQFNSCNPIVNLYQGVRIADARITSYSAEHWTDSLIVNNNTVYNLSDFSTDYVSLGDPFNIEIPPYLLTSGSNTFQIETADSPVNKTGCSNNNTLIYKGLVNFSSTRTDVVEQAEGCKWTIEFEDGTFLNETIPSTYTGSDTCSYTASSISYKTNDAYDISVYNILSSIDFDDDGRVLFNFAAEDLDISINILSNIPFLWGPSIVETRVWQ